MPSQRDQAVQPSDFPAPATPSDFPVDQAEKPSVDELGKMAGKGLLLPTWMPGDIKLKEIYIWGGPMLVYSNRDVKSYRDGNITIEISRSTDSPTYDQLKNFLSVAGNGITYDGNTTIQTSKSTAKYGKSSEVVKIGDLNVVVTEDAAPDPWMEAHGQNPIVTYFWHDGFYYAVTGIKGEVSKEQIIEVIAKMEPIGPKTMRKQSG
jgi:hypothetical protein